MPLSTLTALTALTLLATPPQSQDCHLSPLEDAFASARDLTGWDVALTGDRLALGTPGKNAPSSDTGGVTLFERIGGAWTRTWELNGFLSSSDMGEALALEGTTLVVGSPVGQVVAVREGRVDVYTWISGQPAHVATLSPSTPAYMGRFGDQVALDGDTIVVGAPREDVSGLVEAGAAYVFERAGGAWSFAERLVSPTPASGARFGSDIAVEGDVVVVGARLAPHPGDCRVFRRVAGTWAHDAQLLSSQPNPTALAYGVAVQAPWIFAAERDSVHVFRDDPGGWTEVQVIDALVSFNTNFGVELAVDGDLLAVGDLVRENGLGVRTGGVIVYRWSGAAWEHATKLSPILGQSNEWFGIGVDLDGDLVVGGAPHADAPGTSSGRAWLCRVPPPVGVAVACPAVPHSGGVPARIVVSGDVSAASPCLRLDAVDLRVGLNLGYFLASQTTATIPQPGGSMGTLCLGGSIVRLRAPGNATFGFTYRGYESLTAEIDPTAFPLPAPGPVQPGETWTFQCWFRDFVGGGATSNFSDAVSVTFQ